MLACPVLLTAALLTPPSDAGSPPVDVDVKPVVIERIDPRLSQVTYSVMFFAEARCSDPTVTAEEQRRRLKGAAMMPLLPEGPYHRVNADTFEMGVWNGVNRRILPLSTRHTRQTLGDESVEAPLVEMPMPRMKWATTFEIETWNILFNESAAQEVSWPREWPAEVRDSLEPQFGIQSDEALFIETVRRVSNDQWRLHPPHLVAKELIRFAVQNIRVVEPDMLCEVTTLVEEPVRRCVNGRTIETGETRMVERTTGDRRFDPNRALLFTGARRAANRGVGSRADVVAACVALLRAAGLPARPVIGAANVDWDHWGETVNENRLVCWGEYYLPEAGWVPFDPAEIDRNTLGRLDVRAPWNGVGGLRGLNRRMPLSYEFIARESTVPDLTMATDLGTPDSIRAMPNRSFETLNLVGCKPPPIRFFVGGWGHRMGDADTFQAWRYPTVDIAIEDRGAAPQ